MTAAGVRAKAAAMDDKILEVPSARRSRKESSFAGSTRFLITLFVLALALRTFIAAPFSIPSGSMLPRMMIGDYLFVAKWPYGFSRYSFPFGLISFEGRILGAGAKRGDVVVFRFPGKDEDYVKRVIGLPGDLVQMRGGVLYLNGEAVPKVRIADYLMPISPNSPCRTFDPSRARIVPGPGGRQLCAYQRYRETLPGGRSYEVLDEGLSPGDNTGVFVVPEGHYFLMGDNRDDSLDSRYPVIAGGMGYVPLDRVVGRAELAFWSTDGSASWINPLSWFTALRTERLATDYHP